MGARKRTTEWVFILRAKVYNRPLRITVLPSDAAVVGCVAATRAKLINIWFGGPLPAISGIRSGRPFLRISEHVAHHRKNQLPIGCEWVESAVLPFFPDVRCQSRLRQRGNSLNP
jgi:hypothetical protein